MHRIRLTSEEYKAYRNWRKNPPRKPKKKRLPPMPKEMRDKLLTPCLHCGHKDLRVINLHHINKVKYPDLVIPLCFNCHMLFHRVVGTKVGNETALEVLDILKKAG